MKRIYFIVPALGLLLFGVAHGRYAEKYEARVAEQKARDDLAKEEKSRAQQTAQLLAVERAKAAAEKRQREREAEQKLEDSRKAERLSADQLRVATLERERKLRAQVDRSRADEKSLESALASLDARRRSLERERDFLARYVKQAEADRAEFFRLIEKLDQAERALAASAPPPKARERHGS